MEKSEVKKQVKEWMIESIQKVLTGEEKEVDLLYIRPNDVIEYIESLGGEFGEFENNGWEWDYWVSITYQGKTYGISGDGYRENSASFYLKEEDEDE